MAIEGWNQAMQAVGNYGGYSGLQSGQPAEGLRQPMAQYTRPANLGQAAGQAMQGMGQAAGAYGVGSPGLGQAAGQAMQGLGQAMGNYGGYNMPPQQNSSGLQVGQNWQQPQYQQPQYQQQPPPPQVSVRPWQNSPATPPPNMAPPQMPTPGIPEGSGPVNNAMSAPRSGKDYWDLNRQQRQRVNSYMQDPSLMEGRSGNMAQIAQASMQRQANRGVAPEAMARPVARADNKMGMSAGGYNVAGAAGGEGKRIGGRAGTIMTAGGPNPAQQRQNRRRM